jgi:phosphoribosylglycinamide formyltransferase-1
MKIAVFVSGGGTNLGAIIKAKNSGIIKSAGIALVISNKEDIYALQRAKEAGIPSAVITRKQYGGKYEDKITDCLNRFGIELIVLAGFTAILSPDFIKKYENKIINIHPSLIPSFCGRGFYGLHVHKAALDYGVKLTGATVHFVSEEVDGGAIILQKAVEILPDDTPELLQKRVMEEAEWEILPRAIELIASGRLTIDGRITKIK